MGHSRRTSNFQEENTHMMSMTDRVPIGVETPKIASGYYLEKEFTKLINMYLLMILYIMVN